MQNFVKLSAAFHKLSCNKENDNAFDGNNCTNY